MQLKQILEPFQNRPPGPMGPGQGMGPRGMMGPMGPGGPMMGPGPDGPRFGPRGHFGPRHRPPQMGPGMDPGRFPGPHMGGPGPRFPGQDGHRFMMPDGGMRPRPLMQQRFPGPDQMGGPGGPRPRHPGPRSMAPPNQGVGDSDIAQVGKLLLVTVSA